ncbi:unnamed protein product [Ilex paraguariensis]|uniref:Uncharacterized protein n=1 Tax=Ilex paraguariensis TaxID=185542 RepID=A0ABC8TZ07_9AQUA
MDVPLLQAPSETEADGLPLVMAQQQNQNECEHIVDISRSNDASSSLSPSDPLPEVNPPGHEDRPSSSLPAITCQTPPSSSNTVNSRNSMFMRRSEGYAHRHRNPLNSGIYCCFVLVKA